MNTNVGNVKK